MSCSYEAMKAAIGDFKRAFYFHLFIHCELTASSGWDGQFQTGAAAFTTREFWKVDKIETKTTLEAKLGFRNLHEIYIQVSKRFGSIHVEAFPVDTKIGLWNNRHRAIHSGHPDDARYDLH